MCNWFWKKVHSLCIMAEWRFSNCAIGSEKGCIVKNAKKLLFCNFSNRYQQLTLPLYSGATALKTSTFAWNSSDFLLMKRSMCVLTSPPKIFWADSWVNSVTSGRRWAVTNSLIVRALISPSRRSERPSSNCKHHHHRLMSRERNPQRTTNSLTH